MLKRKKRGGGHGAGEKGMILQPSEWVIMEKLWEEAPRTLMQLFHALEKEPGWSKSTVSTLLGRMADKGILTVQEGGKARLYYPGVDREDAALAETESLLERVYQGSVSMMMSTLIRQKALDRGEVEELYGILQGLEEEEDD